MDTKRTFPRVKHFEGLYGDLEHKPQPDYLFLEDIATRSEKFHWVIRPHFHSFLYQFFFVKEGHTILTGSTGKIKIPSPCILVFAPNVIHGLEYSTNVKGKILTISENIVDKIFQKPSVVLNGFDSNQLIKIKHESVQNFNELMKILFDIEIEMFSEREEKRQMIYANLTRLFVSVYRLLPDVTALKMFDPTSKLYLRFLALVKSERSFPTIAAFAKELSVTDTHLNRVCKKTVKKTAYLIVQEQKMKKAQSYLLHTSYSISEIAWLLNYNYANHFARVFKTIVGVTPRAFREKR